MNFFRSWQLNPAILKTKCQHPGHENYIVRELAVKNGSRVLQRFEDEFQ